MSSKSMDDVELLINHGIYIPTQTIMLTGDVNESMYETLVMGLTLIKARKNGSTDITIELNSQGGCEYSGFAIYDRIKACDFPITIRVTGSAMSMGSIILQAADKRLLGPGSTIMLHDGEMDITGTPENIVAWASHGQSMCEHMYNIYAEVSGKPASYWKRKCKKDYILSAEQAIQLGLADGYL